MKCCFFFMLQVISIGRFKWVSFGQVKAKKTRAILKAGPIRTGESQKSKEESESLMTPFFWGMISTMLFSKPSPFENP
jgi:hypothetical protein